MNAQEKWKAIFRRHKIAAFEQKLEFSYVYRIHEKEIRREAALERIVARQARTIEARDRELLGLAVVLASRDITIEAQAQRIEELEVAKNELRELRMAIIEGAIP